MSWLKPGLAVHRSALPLRMAKELTDGVKLCQYSFAYKADGDASFTDTGKQIDSCQPVSGVGIFTKTFNGAPRSVITDFDWFDLTIP